MTKRILTLTLLLVLCLGLLLTSCGKTKEPSVTTPQTTPQPTTPPEPETVYVDVVKDGASAYQLIQPARSQYAGVSDVVFSVYEEISKLGASVPILNDQKAEQPLEILVGDTSRAASGAIADRVAAAANADSFYYVVAELDGKILLYANDTVGYTYLKDYFLATYVKDGTIRIPKDCFDLQSMTWVAYREYLDEQARLEAERIEAEKKARLEALKATNAAFVTSDFGSITPLPSTAYPLPDVFPTEGEHPRILFTKNTIGQIRENLTANENKPAYSRYLEYSDFETDGILPKVDDPNGDNMNYNILAYIEAKAFRYALTGEEIYAYEAVIAIKNFMKTLFIATTPERSIHDYCRAYGYTMYIAACVYDWCYPVLTSTDKQQIVAGVETFLGPNFEVGFPPKGQGSVTGHGTEAQILRDWLAFGMATYGDYSDIYNYVAGRVVSEYVPSTEFYLASGSHWQGSSYGAYRYFMLLYAQTLLSQMTDGSYKLFSDNLARPIVTFMNYLRPDDQGLRIGDVYSEGATTFSYGTYNIDAFYVAVLYEDAVAKGFAKSGLNNFSSFSLNNCSLSPVMFLALNDPTLEPITDPLGSLPLVHYNGSPLGSIIARTAWNDTNAVMVYMKIGEAFSANHEHKDAGSFQIFYKGILASDSGYYDSYGTAHDLTYNKQTISSNCLLIYNPSYSDAGSWTYSGGQTVHRPGANGENSNLAVWLGKSTSRQATILGSDYATRLDGGKEEYVFSYLAGDLTNAYDLDTVDEVSRYMLSVMTGDPENPMAFVVYDRITSLDKNYKKTFLLHVQQEPTVDNATMSAVVTNTKRTNSGKMFVQSLLTDVTYTVIGGPGKEFMVNGKNYPLSKTLPETWIQESGWGRIEISPKEASLTDRLLTVMYVTDAKSTAAMVPAKAIESPLFVGADIFDKVTVFPKDAGTVGVECSFATEASSAEKTYYIAGLTAGNWMVSVNGSKVSTESVEKGGVLTFTAPAGTVTLTPAFAPIRYELGGGKLADGHSLPDSYVYGEVTAIPTVGVEKYGSEFLGWYTTPTFEAGSEFIATAPSTTGTLTLYAKWNRLFTVVDYVAESGTEIVGSYEQRYVGERITLPQGVYASGKCFLGWYTTPTFEEGTKIYEIPAGLEPEEDIRVYARLENAFFTLASAVDDKISHQGTGIEKTEDGFVWSNDGCIGGVHFTVGISSQSSLYSLTFDLQRIDGKRPTDFTIRLRPKTGNKIDTAIVTLKDGILRLGSSGGPQLLDLNTDGERHTVTVVFSSDNAGMTAGAAAPSGSQTTANEYRSTITAVGYVDGVKVTEAKISTFLTFGDSFNYVHGDGTAFPSKMNQMQFYSGQITDPTKYGKVLIDEIYVSEKDLSK